MDSTVFVDLILIGFGQLNLWHYKNSVICNSFFRWNYFLYRRKFLPSDHLILQPMKLNHIFGALLSDQSETTTLLTTIFTFYFFLTPGISIFITSFSFYKTKIPLWRQIYILYKYIENSLN